MISRNAHSNSPAVQARRLHTMTQHPVRWAVQQKLLRMANARSAAKVAAFNAARDRFGIAWREAGFPLNFDGLREFLGADWPEGGAE